MFLLCQLEQLVEGKSRGFQRNGIAIVAVRKNQQVYAYVNRCPHRGIPLEWQPDDFLDYSAEFIQCATHGALFSISSGECIAGPCVGQGLEPLQVSIDAQQQVWVNELDD